MVVAFTLALFGLLAGCGGGGDESGTPSSLPLEAATTTVDPSPTSSPEAPAEAADAQSQLTPEMFEGMLATDGGRTLLVSSIADEVGIEPAEAECLLDAIPIDILVDAAGAFLSGDVDGGFFSSEQVTQLTPLLDSCGIDADVFVS